MELLFDSIEERCVECDKDMMERIMLNLLSNSVKYGKRGGKVYIYIEEENDIVLIHVSNNGYVIDRGRHANLIYMINLLKLINH